MADFPFISEEQLINVTGRRHEDYDSQLKHWNFLKQTYKGGPAYFTENNIFKHYKEGDQSYLTRKNRAYRFNHSKECVDLINKYVFKGHIARGEDAPDYLKSFWKEASWERRSIDQLIYQISTQSSIYGKPWIVIDTSDCGHRGTMTIRQQKESGFRVYAHVIEPQNAMDMSYDDDGCLEWFLIRETYKDDENPFEDMGAIYEQYRLWTKNDWYLIRDKSIAHHHNVGINRQSLAVKNPTQDHKYELVDYGEHNLGEVPIIPANHVEAPEGEISPGLIGDIAYLDRAVANYLSNLDEIIQHQTFSQLAIPIQGLQHLPAAVDDCDDGAITNKNSQHDKLIEMGTKSIFTYDGSDGAAPHYLNPDPRQAGLILDVIGTINKEIYSSIGLSAERTGSDNAAGVDHTSGVSKAFDFDRVNSLLVNKGRSLNRIENGIAYFVALYNGDDPKDEYVSYSEDYDTRTLDDDLALIKELTEIAAPEGLRKHVMGELTKKTFPQLTKELVVKLKADLEKWEPLSPLDQPDPVPVAGGSSTTTKKSTQKPVPGKANNQGQVVSKK